MDLSTTIIPKSDQQNADDLISGPRTIKITAVQPGSKEQPVSINFEGDNGRPYKPSKSMRRVLVTMWGCEGANYIGRRLTIYRDPEVKFGGDAVGGIKISHASDIVNVLTITLTETRGKRKPHIVTPIGTEAKPIVLTDLPPEWESWTAEERGTNRASKGLGLLKQWWGSLTKEEREPLNAKLQSDWKPAAEAADKLTAEKAAIQTA